MRTIDPRAKVRIPEGRGPLRRRLARYRGNTAMGVALLCLDSRFSPSITLSGVAYEPPPRETVGVFLDELHARGIVAHFRRPRGAAIDGACGQLRARAEG